MKHVWKMLMAALLVCMLLLPAGAVAEEQKTYAEARKDDVCIRSSAETTGNVLLTLDTGYEFEVVDLVIDSATTRVTWLRVECVNPATNATVTGYVAWSDVNFGIIPDSNLAGSVTPGTPDDGEDEEDPKEEVTMKPSVDDPLGGGDKDDVVVVENKAKSALSVGAYDEPSTSGDVVVIIPANTVVDVTGWVMNDRLWYRVSYNGKTGFVPDSMLEMVGEDEEEDKPVYTPVGKGVTQNTNGVNLRAEPSTSATSKAKLVSGIEVELLSIPEKFDTNHWFMVRYKDMVGYIQAPYIKVLTGGTDEPTDQPGDLTGVIGIIVNTNGVNFREKEDKNSTSMGLLKADTVVEVLRIPLKFDSNHWFKVRYGGKVGYIQAPYVRVPSLEGEDDPTDTPTDAPIGTIEGVIQNTNGVNFREKADKNSTSMAQLKAGTKVQVVLPLPDDYTDKYWFKVIYDGKTGYIQAPYVKIAGITDQPTSGPAVKPEDETMVGIGLIQNTNGVNFREKADKNSTSMAQLKAGALVDVLLPLPKVNDANHWFRVRYDGKVGYIQAPYVYLPGYEFPGKDDEPTDTPDKDYLYDGVIQNTNGVNFRKGPGTQYDSIVRLKSGVKVEVLDPMPDDFTEDSWFKVRYNGTTGYIQAPYVYIKGVTGDPEDEPTDAPEWDEDVIGLGMITSTNGVNLREGPSVHYDSLGKLTAGTNVYLLKIPSGTDSDSWFKIRVGGKDGYVQAPYVVVLQGDIPKDDDDDNGVLGVGVVTSTDGVNFRTGPSTEYKSMGKLPADTPVELLFIPATVSEDHWYRVAYNGKTGYIQSPFIRVVSIDVDALPDVSEYGYAKLLQSSANLRDTASGTTVVDWKGKGSLLRIAGDSVTSGYYEWIPVFYPADSAIYYVRADMVQIVTVENGQIVTPTPAPASRYGYVLTTGQNVNLRIQPDEESIAQIPKGTVLVCVDDPIDPWNSNYTWYQVVYNGMYGYVRGDYVVVCDRNGDPLDEDEDPDDTDEPVVIRGYIKVTPLTAGNRVHLREKPAGSSLGLLDGGLILPVIDNKIAAGVYGQYGWYKVKTADGRTGYIRDDCAVVCDKDGNATDTPDVPSVEVVSGYVMVTGNNVYVRQSPFGVGLGNVATGTVWQIVGEAKVSNNITWYNIKAYDKEWITGYIHGDYVYKLTDAEADIYEATGAKPDLDDQPSDSASQYVITVNTNGLNIRESYSQDSTSRYKVGSGVVMEYIGTKKVGTVTWYNVIYKDIELWAHGDYLRVMTEAEYKSYLAQNPDFEPDVKDFLGYVITTQSNVSVLNAADGSKKVATVASKGTVVKYYTTKIFAGGEYWYRVYVDDKFGYVNADQVKLCDQYGEPLPEPEYGDNDAPKTQQESIYSTLKKGSSGEAVTNLVQELINQGYYTGKVTSSFTSAVKTAVEAFQKAHGLDVDGIADSATQHALFGTVPVGAGDTSNLSFPIYKVEKIDWFDGGIQQMIPRGANFKIYDVKTGIVWWAHRWAGGYHADIETLTKADSNRLCQIYGVSSLEQIVKDNLWERRPCLVTIGTRTFACSLDGMQHNPDGDTIGNNGMDGQICLHFTNSLGHSSGSVSESHSEAIEYAYRYNYTNLPNYMGK